jgi:hypothetical protein
MTRVSNSERIGRHQAHQGAQRREHQRVAERRAARTEVQVVGQGEATGVTAYGAALAETEDQDDHQRHQQQQQEPQGRGQEHQQGDASAEAAPLANLDRQGMARLHRLRVGGGIHG